MPLVFKDVTWKLIWDFQLITYEDRQLAFYSFVLEYRRKAGNFTN